MKRNRMSAIVMCALLFSGCSTNSSVSPGGGETSQGLTGSVKIDGSSTVLPITSAVAEEFMKLNPNVKVTVGRKGTGGGFQRFCINETDINDASRPIKSLEQELSEENKIEYIECPVGFDGISVLVNPNNSFVDHLTVEELRKIWQPGSTVKTWEDVRPGWPQEEIKLYGPGAASGTFDYFTKVINGEEGASRTDFTASEDDNTLVTGIAGDDNALGYFGFAYYVENRDKLKLVSIDGGAGPVAASFDTIKDGVYRPLSRPVFIYINKEAAERPEVDAFVTFYFEHAATLVGDVGYIPFSDEIYETILTRFSERKVGSIFSGAGEEATLSQVLNGAP